MPRVLETPVCLLENKRRKPALSFVSLSHVDLSFFSASLSLETFWLVWCISLFRSDWDIRLMLVSFISNTPDYWVVNIPKHHILCVLYKEIGGLWWLDSLHAETSTPFQSLTIILCVYVKHDWATADMWQNGGSKVTHTHSHTCTHDNRSHSHTGWARELEICGIIWNLSVFRAHTCTLLSAGAFWKHPSITFNPSCLNSGVCLCESFRDGSEEVVPLNSLACDPEKG